ncbi:MAG: SseB family protein [Lachnospiraceae bacterium]|nr:SseB family protein [Lachnospiraceae bacterium]
MQAQMVGGLQLSDAEKERETVFNIMLERQHSEPSEKNKESLVSALKETQVYIPMHFEFAPSEIEKLKASKDPSQLDLSKVKFSPLFLQNSKTGEKILPCYSKVEEFSDQEKKNKVPFMRMAMENVLRIADKLPDAFDFVFDFHTHPVRMTLDELMEGLGLSDNSEEEGSEE